MRRGLFCQEEYMGTSLFLEKWMGRSPLSRMVGIAGNRWLNLYKMGPTRRRRGLPCRKNLGGLQ